MVDAKKVIRKVIMREMTKDDRAKLTNFGITDISPVTNIAENTNIRLTSIGNLYTFFTNIKR
jgi:hypothetical protein